MKYTVIVEKRVPGCDCGKTLPGWGPKQVLANFFSESDRLLLDIAKAVGDKAWIALERKRCVGCKPRGGSLAYQVTYGRASGSAVCVDAPDRHKAAGFAQGRTTHRVYL